MVVRQLAAPSRSLLWSPWPLRWPRTALLAARGCSTLPPEAPSFSEEEFRNTVAGGASALGHGEMGAGVDEMRVFWRGRGARSALTEELAQLEAAFVAMLEDDANV